MHGTRFLKLLMHGWPMEHRQQVLLPKLGESIVSATVVRWCKQEGDLVNLDEALLEVATDKVNSEIPAPAAGILEKILVDPSQEVQVGEPLAILRLVSTSPVTSPPEGPTYSPALLHLAQQHHISMETLASIPGTGAGGRLSKKDLEAYLQQQSPPSHSDPEVEPIKMTGMRKTIADNMVRSFYEAPHASLMTEIDVTEIMKLIHKEKERFLATHQAKLTITSFVAQALVQALKDYPLLNASVEGDTILVKRRVNLGVAVSVDQGIMVPVIKAANHCSLTQLAQQLHSLAVRARSGQLQPDDVTEGTITLSNFGTSGVIMGIPIIRFPEVAILGMGAIQKKIVPLGEESFCVRSILHLSLTFDHRVIDGMYGCGYLNAVQQFLEQRSVTLYQEASL